MSTISDAIIKDHRELEQYYNEVINSSDPDHQQRFGNQFTWELARHSVGEELVVYPSFEKYLGDKGKTMAENDRREHHEVRVSFAIPLLCTSFCMLGHGIPAHEFDSLPTP